jgi:23S rRNA pseudouridine2605 synthase
MDITLDRQQGANAWLTVGLREGKNREIRRTMEAVGLSVNRLIRVSYGPFQLGQLKQGEVEEIRRKVLRDQLGLPAIDETGEARKAAGKKFVRRKKRTGDFGGPGQPGRPQPSGDKRGGAKGKPRSADPSARLGDRHSRSGKPARGRPDRRK